MSKTIRLGLFIVVTLLMLGIGVFLIGSKDLLFKSTYQVRADFKNVGGLAAGAEVRVGGMHQGTVENIQLPKRPDQKVVVVMNLDSSTHDLVKKDSVASIKSEGLLGDKYIEVSFGSVDGEKLKSGETIESLPPTDFSDLVKKTDTVLDSAKDTMQNFSDISAKVNGGQGSMGALINDKTMYKQISGGAAAFQDDMDALKHNFLLRGFFKKRGYQDPGDLTKYAIAKLPPGEPVKTFVYDANKLFDKEAKLKNEKTLSDAGKFLEQSKYNLVAVTATVAKGDTEQVRILTEARTTVVRNYIVQNFKLDDTRIKTLGLGKSTESPEGGQLTILVY